MASSSGVSLGSYSPLTKSGSNDDLPAVMDQKKRKRMLSNRESARRSRMRKQQHLNDLMGEANQLKKKKCQMRALVGLYTQKYMVVEAQNSVLRTQVTELTAWLNSLNDILQCMNWSGSSGNRQTMFSDCFINPWSLLLVNQPTMAAPSMIQYY